MTTSNLMIRILMIVCGALIGLSIVYAVTGTFDGSVLLGFVIGAVIFALIYYTVMRLRKQ